MFQGIRRKIHDYVYKEKEDLVSQLIVTNYQNHMKLMCVLTSLTMKIADENGEVLLENDFIDTVIDEEDPLPS